MFALQFVPLGYEQITDLTAATGLTVPAGANFALIGAEGAAVRWTDDGSDPTAMVGMPMADTDPPLQYSGTLAAMLFIQQASSAKLNVSYYRIAG